MPESLSLKRLLPLCGGANLTVRQNLRGSGGKTEGLRDAKLVQDFPTTIILKVNSRVGPAERASGPGHFKALSGAAFHREQQGRYSPT